MLTSEYGTVALPVKPAAGMYVNDPSRLPENAPELAAPYCGVRPQVVSLNSTPEAGTSSWVSNSVK